MKRAESIKDEEIDFTSEDAFHLSDSMSKASLQMSLTSGVSPQLQDALQFEN